MLSRIGIAFEVIPSNREEKTSTLEPACMVQELSQMKAADIWNQLPEDEKATAVVIGADTVVARESEIMGKPHSMEEAREMLFKLQGRTHQVYTGVSLLWQRDGKKEERSFYEKTHVTVFPMSQQEIAAYAATGEPMDKAGPYGIQGSFAAFIQGIQGDYNNVVGLPTGQLYQQLKKEGLLEQIQIRNRKL